MKREKQRNQRRPKSQVTEQVKTIKILLNVMILIEKFSRQVSSGHMTQGLHFKQS